MTVHALPGAPSAATGRPRGKRWPMWLALAICAAPVVASYVTLYVVKPGSAQAAYGRLIQPAAEMPDLQATDLDGRMQPLRALKRQWLLVVVDGGACASECDKRLFMQRQLREMLGRERDRVDKVWLVIDDAPVSPALRQALQATSSMHVLRVARKDVAAWLRPDDGRRLEDHLYVVDPMGNWMMRFPPDAEPRRVFKDIDRLLRASASWDRPGRGS